MVDGDVELFIQELKTREPALISTGTYLVVEKLKVLVYRNFSRRVFNIIVAELTQAGKPEQKHKQDLRPYQHAFQWQDGCDADETTCILANMISIGAIRGYMSDEHQKIVFSKDAPFPPVAGLCAKG